MVKREFLSGAWPVTYRSFRKTNHPAIVGFLMPFMAAGLASAYVLYQRGDLVSFWFRACFLVLIPLMLLGGLILSLKSIPLIKVRGDKDYAYSGLVLNIFFTLLYVASLIYLLATGQP
jgi:hypothetical protein